MLLIFLDGYELSKKRGNTMKDLNEQRKDKQIGKHNSTTASDQQSVQMVKQAFKDDQAIAHVAKDIAITVKDGAITLDGEVSTEQQSNLASNTAKAVGGVDEVQNRIEVTNNK